MERVIIFAPHPDDDIIACGGTIAKHIQKGNELAITYISSGEAGSLSYSAEELASLRKEEARRAAAHLGVYDLIFLNNPDGYISFTREPLEQIVKLIREKKPTMVYLPHEREANRDHQTTCQLVIEACKRAAGPWFQACGPDPWSVSSVLTYEVWTPLHTYNLVEDISDYIDVKLAALREHKSQIESIAYDEAVQGLNRFRGVMSGAGQYCECFQILKA